MSAKAKKPGRPAKGHTGRQRKLSCPTCGFICYASASAITSAGLPACGCGAPIVLVNVRDIALIEPERLEQSLRMTSRKQRTAAMRELGWLDGIERRNAGRRSPQPQCSADGCSKFRKRGDRFCAEHRELEAIPF
jgi:hypothetical protein